MSWDLYINFLIALLAIINPVAILPMWSEHLVRESFSRNQASYC